MRKMVGHRCALLDAVGPVVLFEMSTDQSDTPEPRSICDRQNPLCNDKKLPVPHCNPVMRLPIVLLGMVLLATVGCAAVCHDPTTAPTGIFPPAKKLIRTEYSLGCSSKPNTTYNNDLFTDGRSRKQL